MSSADISKYAGVLFFRKIKQRNMLFKILIPNFIHDEYLAEAPSNIAEEIAIDLKESMELAGDRFVNTVHLTATPQVTTEWVH